MHHNQLILKNHGIVGEHVYSQGTITYKPKPMCNAVDRRKDVVIVVEKPEGTTAGYSRNNLKLTFKTSMATLTT